jgi:hypothetical protein
MSVYKSANARIAPKSLPEKFYDPALLARSGPKGRVRQRAHAAFFGSKQAKPA